MNKLKQIKQAIINTPPQRLAKIEYQSYILNIIGVSVVCAILIFKGLWWIIFAFIFSIGVSFSQGIGAYQRYKTISSLMGEEYNFKKDKSPTRKRHYVIQKTLGKYFWIAIVVFSYFTISYFVPLTKWYTAVYRGILVLVLYILIYFFPIYWIANICKGVKNGKKEKGT